MDYHDYVIKDGRFIGKFEEMYQSCDNPWNQTNDVVQSYQKMASLSSIIRINPKSVLEVGCGLGYYTGFLAKMFPNIQFEGMDISETAVVKARQNFPDVKFTVGNIAKFLPPPEYDIIIFSEILWYILDDLDGIIRNMKKIFRGRHLLINQSFYEEGKQKYGKEYFTSPEEMVEYFGMECQAMIISHTKGESSYGSHVDLIVNNG